MKDKKQEKRMLKKTIKALISAAAAALVAIAAFWIPPGSFLRAFKIPPILEGEVRIHFPDVGQGDCVIVEFSAGDLLMIDSGDGSFLHNNYLIKYVKGLSPKHFSMLLTHPDKDHYGGFSALFEVYHPETFYFPILVEDSPDYREFLKALNNVGCKMERMTRYGSIERESCSLVCLSPFPTGETEANDASTVLYFDCGGINGVFCGDIPASRELQLTEEYLLDETFFDIPGHSVRLNNLDILKLAHHGSGNSSCEEWLNLLSPQTAVICCGAGNSYGHPASDALSRLKEASPDVEIYRTDELCGVVISIKDGAYSVNSGAFS